MTKKVIYRAAILPYYVDNNVLKMLFMKPSDSEFGGDAFQISKGKIEENEDAEDAALREGQEELGLFRGNIEDVHNLGNFLGRTTVFVGRIKDPALFGLPNFETAETKWLTPKEFYEIGRDIHRPVVKAAVRYIERNQ